MAKLVWSGIVIWLAFSGWVDGFAEYHFNETELSLLEAHEASLVGHNPLLVGLTLIHGASAKGAVCLDGTLPGYHLHLGHGSGANSWLIHLEGGGWCNNVRSCVYRTTTRRGSSNFMEKEVPFTGILSNNAEQNPGFRPVTSMDYQTLLFFSYLKTLTALLTSWFPVILDFFNWNRVRLRYCDGGSFTGDSEDKTYKLKFRGERIWFAAMEDLMSEGMRHAKQALLSGCSAGGLAAIIHCDKFHGLFPSTTRVKCLSDAGLFLDVPDVSGGRTLRDLYGGVVGLQRMQKNLPRICTDHLDPTSCFFPQNLIASVRTPLFILNAAYDTWQIQSSIAPPSADPQGYWHHCRLNHDKCNRDQIKFLQGFRNRMLNAVRDFSRSSHNGLFINSCFSHCQTERQDTWFAHNSPVIGKKGIAEAVGDWYFERGGVKEAIDCAYPCDKTCHHLVFE